MLLTVFEDRQANVQVVGHGNTGRGGKQQLTGQGELTHLSLPHDGKLMLTDKPGELEDQLISPNKTFRLVCADNTRGRGDSTGDYAGTGNWNTATLDRFGTTIHLPYLDDEHQKSILTRKFPAIAPNLIQNMVTLSTRIQTAYKNGSQTISMSPRTLLSWANKAQVFRNVNKAFVMAYFEKLDVSEDYQGHFFELSPEIAKAVIKTIKSLIYG